MPIIWPARYAPDRTVAHVRNEIAIQTPPEAVWHCLIHAAAWPDWYPNSAQIRIENGAETLSPQANFTWRTFGVTVRSQIQEFHPPHRIAWDGVGFLLNIYHAWLIEPRPGGSWVLTEETQNGLAARAQNLLLPKRMFRGHELWLARLKQISEKC